MRIDIVTIFPEYLAPLNVSLVGKALARGVLDVRVHDLRDWTHDRHRTVDDTPFGGGPGMVMKPEPWGEALEAITGRPGAGADRAGADYARPEHAGSVDAGLVGAGADHARFEPAGPDGAGPDGAGPDGAGPVQAGSDGAGSVGVTGPEGRSVGARSDGAGADGAGSVAAGSVPAAQAVHPGGPTLVVPTPSGRPFTQEVAVELSRRPWLVFTPARYEGIDRRVIEDAATRMPVEELSIGDYVLAGGEAAVLVMVEAVARLLPGVLGNAESHRDDSFAPGPMANLLEGPVYTKPPEWRGRPVPDVLLSGHHGRIARWRRDEALRRTAAVRPDLIARCEPDALDKHDRELLARLGWSPGPGPDGPFWHSTDAVEE